MQADSDARELCVQASVRSDVTVFHKINSSGSVLCCLLPLKSSNCLPGIMETLQHTKSLDLSERTRRHSEFCNDKFHILCTLHRDIFA
jgi:hypothetical protein